MRILNDNYFQLPSSRIKLKNTLLFLAKIPLRIPMWFASMFVTTLAINPMSVKKQRPLHRIHFTDDMSDQGLVIVNVCPPPPYKRLNDFFLKIKHAFKKLPFLPERMKSPTTHHLYESKAKKHIDEVIVKVQQLLAGQSTAYKCQGIAFAKTNIKLKGLEHLDAVLRQYLLNSFEALTDEKTTASACPSDINFFTLETKSGSVLDSIAVSSQSAQTQSMSERKFIISCMGRDQNYLNWLKDYSYTAERKNLTIIGFNCRGIDQSKGMIWTEHNMVEDCIAQFKRLIALGAKAENIGLEGYCIGASFATLAAAKLHRQGHPVMLYNDRGFRSITRFISGFLLPKPNESLINPLTWLKLGAFVFIYTFALPVIWFAGWRMNAAAAWETIPAANKNYSVIRSGNDDLTGWGSDGIVHNGWASMASLMDERRKSLSIKQKKHQSLMPDEEAFLAKNPAQEHYIKVAHPEQHGPSVIPHLLARRHFVKTQDETVGLREHMLETFSP